MKKKRTKKRDRRTLIERQTAEERRALIEATKRRLGVRLDFTSKKLGSRVADTGKSVKVVQCNECGRKGVPSRALLPSILVIHRGLLREGKFSLLKSNFSSDDPNPPHCVNSPGTIVV